MVPLPCVSQLFRIIMMIIIIMPSSHSPLSHSLRTRSTRQLHIMLMRGFHLRAQFYRLGINHDIRLGYHPLHPRLSRPSDIRFKLASYRQTRCLSLEANYLSSRSYGPAPPRKNPILCCQQSPPRREYLKCTGNVK